MTDLSGTLMNLQLDWWGCHRSGSEPKPGDITNKTCYMFLHKSVKMHNMCIILYSIDKQYLCRRGTTNKNISARRNFNRFIYATYFKCFKFIYIHILIIVSTPF
jgi:hypothetical protein